MPLEVRVFDFDLPRLPAFTVLVGADVAATCVSREAARWFGGDTTRYRGRLAGKYIWGEQRVDRAAGLSLARMLAERRMSLHMYYDWTGAYAVSWRYDPSTEQARFDFTVFDHNLGILFDQLGANCVTLVSQHRTGAGSPGYFQDGGPWWPTVASSHRHTPNSEAFAHDLARAWAGGTARHLAEKAWLDRAYVYISDEPLPKVIDITTRYGAALKQAAPRLKTFVAGRGRYGWRAHYERIDVFSGDRVDAALERRFREQGTVYWGPYNRISDVVYPLAGARLIGFDSWLRGWPAYFHWASAFIQTHDFWINPGGYWYHGEIPGYPYGTFVRSPETLTGDLVYIWPDDEPLPVPPTREPASRFIMPIGTQEDVRFVPDPEDRPFASSLRLEALRESIDDYAYMQLLREAVETLPEGDPLRDTYATLTRRLQGLMDAAQLDTDVHGVVGRGASVVATEAFQSLRHDVAEALERALQSTASPQ